MPNPYAPPLHDTPASEEAATSAGSYRIEGDELIVRDGTRLPKICLKTGARGRNERTQQLMWIPPWARLFGALSALASRKATITFYLSDEAEHQRQTGLRLLYGSLLGGVLGVAATWAMDMHVMALAIMVGALVVLIVGSRLSTPYRIRSIVDERAYLKLPPAALRAFAASAAERRHRRKKAKRMGATGRSKTWL